MPVSWLYSKNHKNTSYVISWNSWFNLKSNYKHIYTRILRLLLNKASPNINFFPTYDFIQQINNVYYKMNLLRLLNIASCIPLQVFSTLSIVYLDRANRFWTHWKIKHQPNEIKINEKKISPFQGFAEKLEALEKIEKGERLIKVASLLFIYLFIH